MKKRAIGTFYGIGIFTGIIIGVIFFAFLPFYNTDVGRLQREQQLYQQNSTVIDIDRVQPQDVQSVQDEVNYDLGIFPVLGILQIVLSTIPLLIAWLGTLINVGVAKEWTWFLTTFFFGIIAIGIYCFFGPKPLTREQVQALRSSPPPVPSNVSSGSALELLQQRYVKGEIDEATFHRMFAQLKAMEQP